MSQNRHLKAELVAESALLLLLLFLLVQGYFLQFIQSLVKAGKWLGDKKAERFVLFCKLVNKNWFERLRPIAVCVQDKDINNEFKNHLGNEVVNYL